jgi:putative ABC transport system permease protein
VTPSYLRTLGGRVIAGRWFSDNELGPSAKVVVVSEALARQYWGRPEASLGARLTFPGPGVWRTVVGVVDDAKWHGLDETARRVLFLPLGQFPVTQAAVLVRADEDPRFLRAALHGIATSLDRDSVVDDFRTMDARLAESVGRPRFAALMLALFSAMALLLGALGVYGLMTESVASRTREIGIRLALGARSTAVLRMVLREGLLVGLAGALVGIVGSLAVSSALSGLLYDISPADPATAVIVPFVLTLVAVVASYLPARRAARVDPVAAIKVDP